jgi:acyl-homoserine-lactone acylase
MRKSDKLRERIGIFVLFLTAIFTITPITSFAQDEVNLGDPEILWDEWGVPHIYASQPSDLFYAFGWSQMKSHGNLILQLYGEARGRAAEYWGEDHLQSDQFVHTMGVPPRSENWYKALPAESKNILDAFVSGMNAYADAHSEMIIDSVEAVLPVKAVDVLSHVQKAIHLTFMVRDPQKIVDDWKDELGSNGWALAPSKTASKNSMLLINPHLPWSGLFKWYETHLNINEFNAYGAALVGTPILGIGFNNHLGWTHTSNTIDNVDHYELTLADGGYLWDGTVKPFEHEQKTILVKRRNGSLKETKFTVTRSIHGPVLSQQGKKALAIRVAGFDQPDLVGQYWEMIRAQNLEQFENALRRLQLPYFNVIYADRAGHIMYLFNGQVPKRPKDVGDWDFWSGLIPGDNSATLWTETHSYDELPRIVDPKSGWVQNANDAPWTATFPQELNPDDYPPYMSPREMDLRSQRSVQMLMEDDSITYEELNTYKHSTQMLMADRILDDLFDYVDGNVMNGTNGDGPNGSNGNHGRRFNRITTNAIDVLRGWDRKADNDSRGAILFYQWIRETRGDIFATPWDENNPLTTPAGLKNPKDAIAALETAAKKIKFFLGSLDISWGEVNKVQIGDLEFPSNGAEGHYGVFRVAWHKDTNGDRKYEHIGGDSFYGLVEFSDPIKASVLLPYGNSSQPGSPNMGDQLELYSNKQMRPVWFTLEEVEQHLFEREVLSSSKGTN